MATTQKVTQPQHAIHDELILVVKRTTLFNNQPAWHGLNNEMADDYVVRIQKHQEFLPRSVMEQDLNYKQIIPYLIFCHNDRYFLMQRTAKATEQRLQNKYSLGIGGHIRQEDITNGSLADWAYREFHEEVDYKGTFTIEALGFLNDDSNAVGQVHIGCVFLLHGTDDMIAVKSELKSGQLMNLAELNTYRDQMESWSQIALDFLHRKQH